MHYIFNQIEEKHRTFDLKYQARWYASLILQNRVELKSFWQVFMQPNAVAKTNACLVICKENKFRLQWFIRLAAWLATPSSSACSSSGPRAISSRTPW